MRVAALWRRMAEGLQALASPRTCAACGGGLGGGEAALCRHCLDKLPRTGFEAWPQNPMKDRMDGRVELISASAAFFFHKDETLRRLIHSFKYGGCRHVAWELGREMGRQAAAAGLNAAYDHIIPVPLHPARERKRGYNQSLLLARGMAAATGLTVCQDILRRQDASGTQTRLNAEERYVNSKGTFALTAHAQELEGCRLLLIDDVFTTGATAEACLVALREIKGTRLGVATLGYAAN